MKVFFSATPHWSALFRIIIGDLNRDFPDDSSQPPKTVAHLCFDRQRDPTTRFGLLEWGDRRRNQVAEKLNYTNTITS
jgi:hypothetical protein